ncbi:MAG: PD-(D/E)XK nuclease family transposase [Saprospiraceae bacterium]|nr:PD-(D/E)XK nuclease family transposase [Saprospiraceae bacterium]
MKKKPYKCKNTEGGKYLSHHAVCDVENGERTINDMDFYFIELPSFKKTLSELIEITDKWIYFIKEAETIQVIPENVDDEGLKAAYQDANKHSWTREELEAYDYADMREQDERGKVELAEKRAKLEIAKKLKDKGLSNDDISDFETIHKI